MKLLDEDGENEAVRWFLAAYGGGSSKTIGAMQAHLKMSGFDGCWPDWCSTAHPSQHLTKGGAQLWIRHLFSLEAQQVAVLEQSQNDRIIADADATRTDFYKRTFAAISGKQEPVAYSVGRSLNWHHGRGVTDAQLYAAPMEPYDQQALELCPACGWKAVIPGEPCLNCGRGEVMKALDAYAAERDALMADAARYQFMKSCTRAAGLDISGWHSWTCQIMRSDIKGATLDEAIDAAIKKAGIETKTDWSAA